MTHHQHSRSGDRRALPQVEGRILRISGNYAVVRIDEIDHRLALPGRWRRAFEPEDQPAAGDRVIVETESGSWRLVSILPRRNFFTRKAAGSKPVPQVIAANLDLAVIVAAAAEPQSPFGLIDRLLVAARLGGIEPALIVNKADLVTLSVLSKWIDNYQHAVEEIILASAVDGRGIAQLGEIASQQTILLAGASGVGKSTLANLIDPALNLRVGEISDYSGKGRHTTSVASLLPLGTGGWLVDTPGLRECAPWGATPETLQDAFPEIARLGSHCAFRNCRHSHEANCAVQSAAGTPDLPGDRYGSYLKLLAELRP
ncbi:MAG: ribosome small subunit-dependent GTPase A [Calditrichaeota bacterium]|nr:ribosome small subunit-dependent GTPase A [Calditrichota bacterium]